MESSATVPRREAVQPVIAGVLAAIVGYASTFTLVLAALAAAGASPAQAGSGLFSVCLAIGLLNIVVAWRVKVPISFAWSTPGVAFLLTVGEPRAAFRPSRAPSSLRRASSSSPGWSNPSPG